MSREKRVLIGAAAISALLVGMVVALKLQGPSNQQQGAEWARKACSHYVSNQTSTTGTPGQPAPASADPSQESTNWQTAADDAAHAARLDPIWQNLAMAANAQLEEWQAAANGQQPSAAQAAAAEQYNINVECRKAMD